MNTAGAGTISGGKDADDGWGVPGVAAVSMTTHSESVARATPVAAAVLRTLLPCWQRRSHFNQAPALITTTEFNKI